MKHLAQIQTEFLQQQPECGRFLTPRQRHRRKMLRRMQQRRDPECIEASHHKEAADKKMKVITVTCRDYDDKLENLLNHIKDIGNVGHSFPIVIDEGSETEGKFGWDGDGADYIKEIKMTYEDE